MKSGLPGVLILLWMFVFLIAMSLASYGADITIGNASVTVSQLGGDGSGLTGLNPSNIQPGTAGIDISGNAATVSNGVYTTGSYSDPAWISSLAGSICWQVNSKNEANLRRQSYCPIVPLLIST